MVLSEENINDYALLTTEENVAAFELFGDLSDDYSWRTYFLTKKARKKRKQITEKRFLKICKDYGKCCYCNVDLTTHDPYLPTHKTKDHIIPKSKGGKITKPCCYKCNNEKGSLMLNSYIFLLSMKLLEAEQKGDNLIYLQTKIKNATKIALWIENKAS